MVFPHESHPTGTPHLDDESLTLRALGETTGSPSDVVSQETHLASCSRCQVDIDQLRAVVRTARTVTDADSLVPPPPIVWTNISAELGLVGNVSPLVAGEPAAARSAQRRSLWLTASAAAVAGVLVGGVTTMAATSGRTDPLVVAAVPIVISTAALAPLPGAVASGDAVLMRQGTARMLQVDIHGLAVKPGFYEVWLMDPTTKGLIALGVLNPSIGLESGRFALPNGVDIAKYPVVDISLEPADGNPGHSGASLVRGTVAT